MNATKKIKNLRLFALFVVPSVFIWMTVVIIPLLYGVAITFTDWNGLSMDIHFIGIKNYIAVFRDTAFLTSMLKTVLYVFLSVLGSNLIAFLLALAVTSGMKGQSLFRTGFFTPNIIGGIILGYIWNFIFSYAITGIGERMGIEGLSTSMLTHPTKALTALIIVTIWQMSGYLMVIYIAGLTNVSQELIEAARIDGASPWQIVRNVKFPLIRNSVTICIFLSITRTFMSFDLNLSLTSGGPYKSTELIAYKIYQTAFSSMEFGKGQAQALVLFVIVVTVSLLQVYFTRRGAVEE
ncbi:carbohydrate ABC transporter permease [Diplocloster agilis]|uniref:Sugar ABC transporter permease n=1 Tax=Diplocloster agilis TaxID=2850323 RepID=A0A949JWZ5_9FIRM|nr:MULTISPECIES: sugar ABC transporter permease [Lachnospiraceae]MBU9735624.1 sugar ABC transporter permease [Diplocloster agilis]MBU9745509.1 sugar ABC transporter permease [Diplocloster agilis]MCU6732362.1 sugar ABC transporter permease [Suonthocola fibrivorans]SCI44499.1 sn-glycerol-3-phosphate transport system permease protein ugpA [uncultured Clostridium sp.]